MRVPHGKPMKILVVTDSPPVPTDIGGRQRTHLLLRALSHIGETDLLLARSVVSLDPQAQERLHAEYRLVGAMPPRTAGQRFPWNAVRLFAQQQVDRVAHNLGNRFRDYEPDPGVSKLANSVARRTAYDVIVGRFLKPACKAGVFGIAPFLLDVDDLDTEVYRSRLSVPMQSYWRKQVISKHYRQLTNVTKHYLPKFAHLWVASTEDVPLIEHPSISVLPNIPFDPPLSVPDANDSSLILLTVASWNHRANVDGVDHFLQRCWPEILTRVPKARYRLVGSQLSAKLKSRWAGIAGVEVVGYVEDLRTEYANCAFAVVPLYEGGGTKIKVLEALSYNRTAAISEHSHRGYGATLVKGKALSVAASDSEFVEACVTLLQSPETRRELAEHGFAAVKAEYSFARFSQSVSEAVSRHQRPPGRRVQAS